MKPAADYTIRASSLYLEVNQIDLLAPLTGETKAVNHNQVKSIHLAVVSTHKGFEG